MKFYRGSAAAARSYVEADRSRVDDYYLAEGTGVANRYVASASSGVRADGALDGDAYERWVAGYDVDTGQRRAGCGPTNGACGSLMRTGERSGEVFDALVSRGEIVVHATEVERIAALTTAGGLVVADTREQVARLNSAIRNHRHSTAQTAQAGGLTAALTTTAGERLGVGDRVATRRNDRDLGVANRDTWTVTALGADGSMAVSGRNGERTLPAGYVRRHVELAYATTIHGAQGETVDHAHLLIGEATGAAAAYVGMTRGRHTNTAHLVADTLEDARVQWVETFNRDRADLGPAHAADRAVDDIDRYGPQAPAHSGALAMQRAALQMPDPEPRRERYRTTQSPSPGIGI